MDTATDTVPFVPAHCGGWPFLDDEHAPKKLLTAVACVRLARRDGPRPSPSPGELAGVLEPGEALRIRSLDLPRPLPTGTITAQQRAAIPTTVELIGRLVPPWTALL